MAHESCLYLVSCMHCPEREV
ncbi:hypothetical protein ENH_00017040 [Eimeria necatrix]|uniref:Uncharacterized protein n=1 Tax=Eimeria necatrix TaxID=51315 RepID=U6MT15_9EIME|nr:hypothetical protein ENH_00017040 [Eimeria necatrix]CDJ66233.1 hypothetical protein ENH_00017040 [Eimeria necatrix]